MAGDRPVTGRMARYELAGDIIMRTIRLLAGTLALVSGVLAAEVSAAELKVLSAGAMRAALQELAPAFETASGHKLKIEYTTAGGVEQKVAADDEIDVAIATKPRMDKLAREAKIVGGTMKTLAGAEIGLAAFATQVPVDVAADPRFDWQDARGPELQPIEHDARGTIG